MYSLIDIVFNLKVTNEFDNCDYDIPLFNDKNFIFANYPSAHNLIGYINAVAELYNYKPETFNDPKPWIQTLDITPWI